MRIYLDFDGVLHPVGSAVRPFGNLPLLAALLKENPAIELVISSAWRAVFSEEEMKERYFPQEVASRIIGVTPVMRDLTRHDEILAHIQQTNYTGDFIVLDDEPHQFPTGWPRLLTCDPDVGLNAEKLEELKRMIVNKPYPS